MFRGTLRGGTLLLLIAASALAGGDNWGHWGYSYRNVDVTVAGTSAYAVNLARSCVQLDSMLSRILGIKTAYRAPTHIYALPAAQLQLFSGSDSGATYRASRYDTIVILDSGEVHAHRYYWGAYFGYTATLLASDRLLHGPDWYMVGVPAVFADVVFEGAKVKIGNITPGFAYTLVTAGALIPMRTFLSLTQHDVRLRGEHYLEIYNAEAWYLAREVFVEGKYRAEFGKYLELMRGGTAEAAAFAASFPFSYEDLDKELARSMRDRGHIYIMDAPPDPGASGETAQPLSAAEFKGRLALLSVRYQKGADAVQLANEALQLDTINQSALRALALAQLAKGAYGESLAAVERLSAPGSAATDADRGEVLAGLAAAAASGAATLPVDAAALRQRAKEAYGRALAANGEDRRSREALALLEPAR
jgi:hypothetical protein